MIVILTNEKWKRKEHAETKFTKSRIQICLQVICFSRNNNMCIGFHHKNFPIITIQLWYKRPKCDFRWIISYEGISQIAILWERSSPSVKQS